jgi:hypothetical protein
MCSGTEDPRFNAADLFGEVARGRDGNVVEVKSSGPGVSDRLAGIDLNSFLEGVNGFAAGNIGLKKPLSLVAEHQAVQFKLQTRLLDPRFKGMVVGHRAQVQE